MFKILHFNEKNGISIIFDEKNTSTMMAMPPYSESSIKKLDEIYDNSVFVDSVKSRAGLTERLRLMMASSFMGNCYSLFSRITDKFSMSLTPLETRKIFVKYAAEEIKKTPISDHFVFLTFAMNFVVGLPAKELEKITDGIERQSSKKAKFLRMMIDVGQFDWEKEPGALIHHAKTQLMPKNQFSQAKAILLFIAQSSRPEVNPLDARSATELYKEVVRCEMAFKQKNGESLSQPWKKWTGTKQKLHPSMYVSSKINKARKDE